MKKLILMWVLIAFSTFSLAQQTSYIETQVQKRGPAQPKAIKLDKRCGYDPNVPFIVGSYTTNPPFSWVDTHQDEEGNITLSLNGYNVDLIQKMAKDMKIQVRTRAYKTDQEALRALQTGEISAFIGMYYDTQFRKAGYTYVTPAYFKNMIGTAVLKSKNLDIKSFDDLKNLKGAVRLDERFYGYIRSALPEGMTIQQVPDSRTAFLKLLKGEVDYLLVSPYSAEAEARRYKMNKDIRIQTLPFPPQEFFIVIGPHTPCQQLANPIAYYLKKTDKGSNAKVQHLISYIDAWGQRFKNDKGLSQELKERETGPQVDLQVIPE